MNLLFLNIGELVQTEISHRKWVAGKDMASLRNIKNAYLYIENEHISAFGKMEDLERKKLHAYTYDVPEIDVSGRLLLPSFCDSHTHIVYAGSREIEYIDKIRGLSYEEIAKRGGGILNSAIRIAESSEQELYESAYRRLMEMASYGTGAVEIKSG